MEEKNKSKNGAGIAIILIIGILVIALACCVVYIIKYNKVLADANNQENNNIEVNVKENLESNKEEDKDNIISIQLSVVYDNNGDPDYKTVDVVDTEEFKQISNIINNLSKSKEQIPEGIGLEFSDKIIVKYSDNKTVEYIVSKDNKLYNTTDKITYTTNNKELTKYIDNISKQTETKTAKMTNDDKYKVYLQNLKEQISSINSHSYITEDYSVDKDLSYIVKLNSKCELSIHYSDEQNEKKYGTDKLATNVIAFYNCYVGNGGMRYLYFIKDDGSVWMADVEGIIYAEATKISITKKSEYKNIVLIRNFNEAIDNEHPGAMNPIFIDIDGNIYN